MLSVEMVLTGKYAGQTVNMHGKKFQNGVLVVRAAQRQDLDPQVRYVERMCQAYPKGSQRLLDAQAHWAKIVEKANGNQLQVHPATEPGNPASVVGVGPVSAGGVSEAPAGTRDGDVTEGPAPGDEGLRSSRSGHEHTGLPAQTVSAIITALEKLDPMTDAHWTELGLPSVEVVATALGDQSINRAAITSAAPTFNREKALEIAAANSV